ncbi:glycosyltransferase involved in cell wall biosynthesis [Chryseobacterium sp. H1D6B]|uniref:glycosyltransferase n=1 Tax=Chryseobacterium sp. H1D6B TaxID=2940588 RepID=UPI0015CC9DAC|nr:glycosyltransferase [Chryseobacterium sp. H1D6B]MDH6251208.1 glycosyltransferase involved in cell wall biosynthesis [Chryseobacterium sp. H1D6B]
MKILFIQHHNFINGSGGTEKICSFLANGFSDSGHQVEIATNQNIEGKPVFKLNENIKITNIFSDNIPQVELKPVFSYKGSNPLQWITYKVQKKTAKRENKKLLKKFGGSDELFKQNLRHRAKAWKTYIDAVKPDIIVTMTISSLLEITFEQEYQIPIVNSVNGRPDYDYSDILWYRSPSEMDLLKKAYQKLSGIQILFESYRDFLPETFNGKVTVIPNPVPQFADNDIVDHQTSKDKFKIINIASLVTDCKQQHLAIDAFSAVSEKFPNWELHFWGVGSDFDFLNDKIQQLNLQERIFLNGFTDNPMSKLKDSDIFIFPSKYEGFPLALTEAMAAGLPSLGFKNCSGVNELIEHGINGFLVHDEADMADSLKILMQDKQMRQRFGENARLAMKKYTPENVFQQWEKLIDMFI